MMRGPARHGLCQSSSSSMPAYLYLSIHLCVCVCARARARVCVMQVDNDRLTEASPLRQLQVPLILIRTLIVIIIHMIPVLILVV